MRFYGLFCTTFFFLSNNGVFRTLSLSLLLPQRHRRNCRYSSTTLFTQHRRKRQSQSIDIDSVSDAEALLACRSHLQRRNKLGLWKAKERRRQGRPASMTNTTAVSDSDVGFFWPDPTQLKYLYRPDKFEEDLSKGIADEEIGKEHETDNGIILGEYLEPYDLGFLGDEVSEAQDHDSSRIEGFDRSVTIDDDYRTHMRRSRAARKTWSDPTFRALWYRRRWGEKRHERQQQLNQKIIDSRLRAINPDEFLASFALANMTEREIAKAIETYIAANRKRSVSRQDSLQSRRAALGGTQQMERLPRDFLLNKDPIQQQLSQQKRSELATVRYQARKKSSRRKHPSLKLSDGQRTASAPSHQALARLQRDVSNKKVPSTKDIELVMKPRRLPKRREVLLQVLSDCFGMKGKCMPPLDTLQTWLLNDSSDRHDDIQYSFCSTASVEQLGKLVLFRTRQAHMSEDDSD